MIWEEGFLWASPIERIISLLIFTTTSVAGIIVTLKRQRLKSEKQLLRIQENDIFALQRDISLQEEHIARKFENQCRAIRSTPNMRNNLHWTNFEDMCNYANQHLNFFPSKLSNQYTLSEQEVKLCILVLLGMNYKEIAQ